MSPFDRPTPEEHAELLSQIGPLPLRGRAWPRWIAGVAWLIMAVIAFRLFVVLGQAAELNLPWTVWLSLLVCFAALLWMSWHMWTSETEISDWGIRQTWISRREVPWSEIQSTKFIPLFASKKLVCFVQKGRPMVFQAGNPQLQSAFARISLVYRKKI
ncbi:MULTISPECIES: hypothetical protein [unclassified Castellaniella]|jgi:hypothetical protein|uniref:hypothetical protein n=1 Tax=unclassified Castellaniella TaxID=2617606 RepID=UPI0033161B94